MSSQAVNRRDFFQQASAGAAGATLTTSLLAKEEAKDAGGGTLAVLGGKPVRTKKFPSWPVVEQNDRDGMLKVLDGGAWCRVSAGAKFDNTFEQVYAKRTQAKYCTTTANGTSALHTSLHALGVGPGDEVIVPPYTFVATINAVLLQYAIPVFVDSDRESMQIDAAKIEAAITPRTACILPVHLGGNVADLDTIVAVGKKHNIPVLEDACQAVLSEWRGRHVGSWGTAGCFSFQNSKNLNSGEGGAIISNDREFMSKAYAFHNNGRGRRGDSFVYNGNGANLRMSEFQSALLLTQMTRLEEQSKRREDNAAYLTKQLVEIPGIRPAKHYAGLTRNAYHLYMFRYDAEAFSGVSRDKFLKALTMEGFPAMSGYTPLNKQTFLKEVLTSKGYKAIYAPERIEAYFKNNELPENDKLCQEAVWFYQSVLLGTHSDMDQIAAAIRKIQRNAGALAKA